MKVNGKDLNLEGDKTIRDLLLELKIKENRVVVELNREIIAKEDYSNINLKEDDTVEVISFVGGGWLVTCGEGECLAAGIVCLVAEG